MKSTGRKLAHEKLAGRQGLGMQVPPLLAHVEIYFIQKGCTTEDAAFFFNRFECQGWKYTNGTPITNWKTSACEWIWAMKYDKAAQRY